MLDFGLSGDLRFLMPMDGIIGPGGATATRQPARNMTSIGIHNAGGRGRLKSSITCCDAWCWARGLACWACLAKQIVLGWDEGVSDRSLASSEGCPADQRDWPAGGLAERELGGGCQLVGDGADGRLHDTAVGVGDAAEVLERQQTRHADGDVD